MELADDARRHAPALDQLKQQHAPAASCSARATTAAYTSSSTSTARSRSADWTPCRSSARPRRSSAAGAGAGRRWLRAGGRDPDKLPDALARAEETLLPALSN